MNFALTYPHSVAPTRKHLTDAGIDLYASQDVIIPTHSFGIVHTGVKIEIPRGYMGQVWPKSRSDYLVAAGIVDEMFRGEILVKVANITNYPLAFGIGTPVAQLVLVPTIYPSLVEVYLDEFNSVKTERGATGGVVTQAAQLEFLSQEELEKEFPDLT